MYNCKFYHYEASTQVRLYSRPIMDGGKRVREDDEGEVSKDIKEAREQRSKASSLNRTVNNIYAISRANRWDYFLTLTFDRNLTDSSNYDLVSKRARKWLNHIKERYCPEMWYIMVPELHKDGEHWHLHGLLGGCNHGLRLVDSGHETPSGKRIYNLDNWHYGFSTVTLVESQNRVASYICKYITKELVGLTPGKQRFWASKNCLRADDVSEEIMIEDRSDFMQTIADRISNLKSVEAPGIGLKTTYIELDMYG